MSYRAPKGTDDVLPPESRKWLRAQRTFTELAEVFGYDIVLTPHFEATELFSRGVGEATEVVEKQMYTFTDKGGRSLTLRPEATASLVRAMVEAGGVNGTKKIAAWGPMFRYERPQQGRRRQFYQGDIEYFGEASPDADVEVIEFGYRYLEEMRVPDVVVALNSIGDAEDRAAYRDLLTGWLRERRDQLSDDARNRIASNPLRVLDSKADAHVVAEAPAPVEHLGDAAAEHFVEVQKGLRRLQIPYRIEGRLVRGLDYYNRTVWEYLATSYEGAQDAAGGGGRYDGLFELLGGRATPAVGVAMGIDRIMLMAERPAEQPALDVFVVIADPGRRDAGLDLVSELRRRGLRTDLDLAERSVSAQFKAADRREAAWAIVVGDEWADGLVTARNLGTGEQETVAVEGIEGWLKGR
ncbi:MAG: histidine--tRNA ligase [Acidimicrobiia bacterium]|nr:MAG: histidine--tRNA ligase [Acidimicrobiia bacterium]